VSLFKLVKRVLQLQMLTVLLVVAGAWALGGDKQGISALLGGLIGFLPNLVFAFLFGRRDPGKSANQVVRAFYVGEGLKLGLTVLLFMIVFQLPGIAALPLFIAFVAVMAVFWFSLLLSNYQNL
jgi:ATP synthase protein I